MVRYDVEEEEPTYSFRLVCREEEDEDEGGGRGGLSDGTSTVSSRHKQRIDSLFRDRRPRPVPQSPAPPRPPSPPTHPVRAELEQMFGGRDQRHRAFLDVRAAVQAHIERLFADASSEPPLLPRPAKAPPQPVLSAASFKGSATVQSTMSRTPSLPDPPPPFHTPSPPPHTPSPPPDTPFPPRDTPSPPVAELQYAVDYLGAAVVDGRAGSLGALQEPLLKLYYEYRVAVARGEVRPGAGQLAITGRGLAVTLQDGRRVLHNPFPTIAVWAAVKLVTRRAPPNASTPHRYAFLPLISDPEAQDKGDLFHALHVPKHALLTAHAHHPPMLACVMRRAGVARLLECHAFVCRSAEDAIVIAANLYQALLRGMGGTPAGPPSGPPSDPPSDTYSDAPHDDPRAVFSDSEVVPVRPPRRKRPSRRGAPSPALRRASSEDMLGGGRHPRGSERRLRRSVSEREGLSLCGTGVVGGGDVYTRVALPRSRSFMSVGDKYSLTDLVAEAPRGKVAAAADEVLRQVVTPRGMSFSEMAPGQREALLRVALTLSRDEMYQRSKNILRQQTRGGGGSGSEGEWSSSTLSSVLRATKRSFSRLGSRASTLQSAYLRDNKSPLRRLVVPTKTRHVPPRTNSRNGAPKTPMPRRGARRSPTDQSCSECGYDSECSSKCYCSLPRRGTSTSSRNKTNGSVNGSNKANSSTNSSGGSGNGSRVRGNGNNSRCGDEVGGEGSGTQLPCDCDTESCAESEKCYCSLRRVRHDGLRLYAINLDSETDATSGAVPPRSHEVPSSPSEVGGDSRTDSWRRAGSGGGGGSSQGTTTTTAATTRRRSPSSCRSTDSETPRRAPPPPPLLLSPHLRRRHASGSVGSGGSQESSDRSSEASSGGSSRRSSGGSASKILLVSAVDPSGRVVYRGASQRRQHPRDADTASILSMKKTAEIAALFSELKLSQTTDLLKDDDHDHEDDHDDDHDDDDNSDDYSTMAANNSFLFSDNIETSLGYLP